MCAVPQAVQGDIRGSYRLVRRLGAGGTGEVWIGRHVVTGGLGAVKLFRARRSREARRFLLAREGAIIARLSHPHIVRLFELGDDHLVTQFVDGSDLGRRLRSGIDAAGALRIAVQIGAALAYAHSVGVVHRDVKPGNILVDRNGNAFLGDFGLASVVDDDPAQALRGGTPGFMAPEQARGAEVGPAADQFSLARTIVEILAGGTDGADVDDALALLPPSAAPLLEILRVATRNRPEDRWPSMAAFVAALRAVPLDDVPPAVRMAPERRVVTPFAWAGNAHRVEEPAPAIGRADFRLSQLEAAGLLPAAACADFRARTGYADFGWALYARTDRLGPMGPSVLARAGELVVFLHGWLWTREIWHDLALAVCRDNADAVVLVPDINGSGESSFAPTVTRAQLRPDALGHAVLDWLSLVGLRELPGVLVAHSMSSLALLMVDQAAFGRRLTRITITPAVMELVPFQRWLARFVALLLALAARSRLMHWLCGWITALPSSGPGLSREQLLTMKRELLRVPPAILSKIARGIADARLPAGALRGVEVVFGDRDPTHPHRVRDVAIARFDGSHDRMHRMASGGHYPHIASHEHPEWSARNQDELVRIIGSVLLSSVEGAVDSTLALPLA
jgi:serine/threonine protein kinase